MSDWQERTKLLFGDNHKKIETSNILIVGLGGVGAVAAEMLCRAGVGKMTIIDSDTVHKTNLNRQIFTTTENIGKKKTEILKQRFLSINPDLEIKAFDIFLKDEETEKILLSEKFDYVIDAIDTLSPKVFLLYTAHKNKLPVISSMGAGGKTNPALVQVADISKSFGCPLARTLRKRLHRLGIYSGFKVVFSPEKIDKSALKFIDEQNKKTTLGTVSYLPATFGIYIAAEVIKDLISK